MKKHLFVVAVSLLGAFTLPTYAAKKKVDSKISGYAGGVSGSCLFSSGGTSASGPTTGSFTASHKKESGTLTLSSTLDASGMATPVFESYRFNNHSLTYTLAISGAVAVGSGTAQIGKDTISYFATFSISGTSYTLQGTIHKTSRRLSLTEVLSTSGSSATFIYSLNRHVHKKN